MVEVEEPDDVEDAVNEFIDVFSTPLSSCSEFYTYYYLTEIVGIDEFDFDFFQVKSELADAFYNYSVYACGRELSNIESGLVFGEDSLDDIRDTQIEDSITDYVRKEYDKRLADMIWSALFEHWPPMRDDRGKDNVHSISNMLQRRFAAFTHSDRFLEMCKVLFSGDFLPPTWGDDSGWRYSYGGDAWEGVAKMAKGKSEMTKTMYVDLMWSVEHNNRLFIDKTDISRDEMRKLRRFRNAAEDMVPLENTTRSALYEGWLQWFLDSAREEEMGPVIGFTALTEREIRRYRSYLPDEMRKWI